MESKSEPESDAKRRIPPDLRSLGVGKERDDTRSAYELLDFGDGRKLERFAGKILDRPSPAAKGPQRKLREEWLTADFVYRDKPEAGWSPEKSPEEWYFGWKSVVMELRMSPFGHVGLFPEQIANWRWLATIADANPFDLPPRALNLFGYTGGSTLALAAAGFQVTHVDASRPTVQWARRNAHLSGLESATIRWIVDDVRDFVKRAARRAEQYDVILMDPPAYGHGTDGQGWELKRDLDDLIVDSLSLLSSQPMAFLLTGHSPIPSITKGPMSGKSWDQLKSRFHQLSKHSVSLTDSNLRKLDFGYAYRFWN